MTVILLVAALALGVIVLVKSVGGALFVTPTNVQRIAEAIAVAEGFYVDGSRPQRNHNPGDMTLDLIGKSIGMDGPFVVYASDYDGWLNLYTQIQKWLDGSSSHATADSTIQQISEFYTANDQTSWAANVANSLGVGIETPIREIS